MKIVFKMKMHNHITYILNFLIFMTVLEITWGIQWLALTKLNDSMACNIGRQNKWLTKMQSRICKESFTQMAKAADLATLTCQDMFKYHRWNCSSINSVPNLTADLMIGTREQGIMYAVSSAALMYTLLRSCSQGDMTNCPCISKPIQLQTLLQTQPLQQMVKMDKITKANLATSLSQDQFKWGGCIDNIKWAIKMTRNFVDSLYKRINNGRKLFTPRSESEYNLKLAYMNQHNNKIGRKILEKSVSINCQCHGLSGSCSMRTCWKTIPATFNGFKLVNHFLSQYRNGIEISGVQMKEYIVEDNIIYLTKSPDYCNKDERTGSVGTKGRQCNETASLSRPQYNCKNMCCGRGYVSYTIQKEERCSCKYYWCCYVKCKKCFVNLKINECI